MREMNERNEQITFMLHCDYVTLHLYCTCRFGMLYCYINFDAFGIMIVHLSHMRCIWYCRANHSANHAVHRTLTQSRSACRRSSSSRSPSCGETVWARMDSKGWETHIIIQAVLATSLVEGHHISFQIPDKTTTSNWCAIAAQVPLCFDPAGFDVVQRCSVQLQQHQCSQCSGCSGCCTSISCCSDSSKLDPSHNVR